MVGCDLSFTRAPKRPHSKTRKALFTFAVAILATAAGGPAAAKKRPPDKPDETPAYQQCSDGTTVEMGQFCPFPTPPPPPLPERPVLAQPPVPGEWRSNWGAIAVDNEGEALGSVTGFARSTEAEETALDDCRAKGGRACLFGYSYKDGCVVMIQGDKSWFFESAPRAEEAADRGLGQCRTGQSGCRVRLSACALPTFVPY